MFYFDLTTTDGIWDLKKAAVVLMPEQPAFLRLDASLELSKARWALDFISRKTNRCVPVLSHRSLGSSVWRRLIEKYAFTQVGVELRLKRGPGQLAARSTIRTRLPESRSDSLREFLAQRASISGNIGLVPQIVLDPAELEALYPTLVGLARNGVSEVLIDPAECSSDKCVRSVRDTLELLRMAGLKELRIHFAATLEQAESWDTRTRNIFSGPRHVDIDVANTCTHNCSFCGLYSQEAMKLHREQGRGAIPPVIKQLMSRRIDPDRCLEFIRSLPPGVRRVQFGGIGDPGTHPRINDFIVEARRRGFMVDVLTNFSYWDATAVERLHEVTRSLTEPSLHFVVNVSAATAETYLKIRPNQPADRFRKVLDTIRHASSLASGEDTRGILFTLLFIVTRENFHEMPDFVRVAREVRAGGVWFKPVEVHGDVHRRLLPSAREYTQYRQAMRGALAEAKRLGVGVYNRSVMENAIKLERLETWE